MVSSSFFPLLLLLGSLSVMTSFVVPRPIRNAAFVSHQIQGTRPLSKKFGMQLRAFPFPDDWIPGKTDEQVAKLVVDDELWGFAINLGDIVRASMIECVKSFKFRPDQLAVEIDRRVKKEVAKAMGKKEFNILDFIFALDKIAKDEVKKLTGADKAEYTKMTDKIDNDVKSYLAMFTGKQEPDGKDIEEAVEKRARKRVGKFLGMERFSLENVAKEIDKKRNDFWKERLGEFWADRANDINNMATRTITGKATYQFGDVTQKLAGDLFGKNKK